MRINSVKKVAFRQWDRQTLRGNWI